MGAGEDEEWLGMTGVRSSRIPFLWVLAAAAVLLAAVGGPAEARGRRPRGREPYAATKGAPVPDDPDARPNELLVRFRPGRAGAAMAAVRDRAGVLVLRKTKLTGIDWYRLKLGPGKQVKQLVEAYRQSDDVLYAEPNYRLHALQDQTFPDDTEFVRLWGLHNTGQAGGTEDADIDAPEAWHTLYSASDIIVAVIDTGVDYTHPELDDNVWTNPGEVAGDGQDNDQNGFVDDVHGWDFAYDDNDPMDSDGHGTHCSGTIGGEGNNGAGVAGVCWSVRIMAVKFLDDTGSGDLSDAIEAINYAVANGAKVLSNSWGGGGGYSQALKDAISAAGEDGCLFVAAAGNDYGNDNDTAPLYPASYDCDNIIAVAATDHDDQLASFSNIGATTVDLGAPGEDIYSTLPGETYATYSGTSMATPHVSGACALVWAAVGDPDTPCDAIRDFILQSVDPVPALDGKCATGGRLNLHRAVTIAAVGRHVFIQAPNGGQGFEGGQTVTVEWSAFGSEWQAADKVELHYSMNGGIDWTLIPGAGNLAYDARTYAWDTTGLTPGDQYRVKAVYKGGPTVFDTSDRDFAVTGALHHFEVEMPTRLANDRRVSGTCLISARDAAGTLITSFGTANTAGRFPVTVSAPGVTVGGLGGTGADLYAGDFLNGVADCEALGMTVSTASPPVLVPFSATGADGTTGMTGFDVEIYVPPDYFTEQFSTQAFDLDNRMVLFEPDSGDDGYVAYSWPISRLPVEHEGGATLDTGDDGTVQVTLAGGHTVYLYDQPYTSFYVGGNGYVTFGAGDTSYRETLDTHFAMPRVCGLFDDLFPLAGQVTYRELGDRVAVTYNGVSEYDTQNANTFQIVLYYDGRIALAYLGVVSEDSIAGLSEGNGQPADFVPSDLSAYPEPDGRFFDLGEPNGGEGYEVGSEVTVLWQSYGSQWADGDRVKLEYSQDSGATWLPIQAAQSLNHDAGTFPWDTTGLAPGDQYRVRVVSVDDAGAFAASDGDFALADAFGRFVVAMAAEVVNGQVVPDGCTVTAVDASGRTITSFGTVGTAERFPVTVSASGATVGGLSGLGNELEPADFIDGVADLAWLSMTVTAATVPSTVRVSATSADGKTGQSGDVDVIEGRDYFTEMFDETPFDLDGLSIHFIPSGGANDYQAFTEPIGELPTDPTGHTTVDFITFDDDYAEIPLTGQTVQLYGESYSSFHVGTNGYVTFFAGDWEYSESFSGHFWLPRISALFDDLEPTEGQVVWAQLADRAVVTWQGVSEYDTGNSNTFQVEMFYNGTIVLSYVGIACTDGLAGLSEGYDTPADFKESDLSAYPPLTGRFLAITAPNGGEAYERGSTVAVTWQAYGDGWQAGERVELDYSTDGGATWGAIPGAGSLAHGLGTFAWDTTGLPPGNQYRVRATAVPDPSLSDSSDGNFRFTGDFDRFDVAISSPQINGRALSGTGTVTAKDASGQTITSFGTQKTAGRFPVELAATDVTVDIAWGGPWLYATDFVNGVANLVPLTTTIATATAPRIVQFTATADSDETGTSGYVEIVRPPDYFTEEFDTWVDPNDWIDIDGLSIIFIPDGSSDHYRAFTKAITALPTDPAGGTMLDLIDDDFETVTLTGGKTVSLYGQSYSTFYVGSNGYVTFGEGDTSWYWSIADHFALPRISGLFLDLVTDNAPQNHVSWEQRTDRAVVTYYQVTEVVYQDSNTFQIEMFFDGRIVLSYSPYPGIESYDGVCGLSKGGGEPGDFVESDLSAYPAWPDRGISIEAPAGGEIFDVGETVTVQWNIWGDEWIGKDRLRLQYSDNAGGIWHSLWGFTVRASDLSFDWDTSGRTPGDAYRVRAYLDTDMTVVGESPGSFTFIRDVTPPAITHTPLADTTNTFGPYTVAALVTDSRGVASVTLHWRLNGGGWTDIAMTATGLANEFAAEIPGSTTSGDVFEYYITATDDVPLFNDAREPAAGDHTFTILDGPQAIHRFPLDSPGTGALAAADPGWDRQGGWAFGKPTGGGTHNGDPTAGYSGQYVFGYNLSGDYPDSMATTHWLTTGALDCTGAWFVSLRFWRWLGVEGGDFDEVCVEASNDGTTWTRVWDNSVSEAIQDTAWAYQEYDISAVASNQPTVYVRWGMGPTDSSVSYPGWNLDDIEVWGHLLASAPLMSPAPLDLSPITDGSIQANWDPNGNPTGTLYQAQCYAGSGFGGALVGDTGYVADRLAYDVTGLDPNAQYSFRVRAQKADTSDESDWVSLGTAYTLAQTPGSLTLVLTAMDGGTLNPDGPAPTSLGIDTLDTRSNPGTTEYAIQLGSDPDQGWLRLDDGTANPDDLTPSTPCGTPSPTGRASASATSSPTPTTPSGPWHATTTTSKAISWSSSPPPSAPARPATSIAATWPQAWTMPTSRP